MKSAIIIFFGLFLLAPNANAQSYADSTEVALIRAKLQDAEIVLFNDDSYVTVHFDAETEVAKLFRDGNEVFEDAEGNQYVNKNGKWFKMNMGISRQMMNLTGPIPPYKKIYPDHAAAHKLAEFMQVTAKTMEENGYEAMNPNNASKNYDLGRGSIYQFDLEGRIVAMRHQPNASVTFVYKPIDLILPTSFETINMPTNLMHMMKKINN